MSRRTVAVVLVCLFGGSVLGAVRAQTPPKTPPGRRPFGRPSFTRSSPDPNRMRWEDYDRQMNEYNAQVRTRRYQSKMSQAAEQQSDSSNTQAAWGIGILAAIVVLFAISIASRKKAARAPPAPVPHSDATENPKLHDCPDCGRQISRRAESCPQCGCPSASDGEDP